MTLAGALERRVPPNGKRLGEERNLRRVEREAKRREWPCELIQIECDPVAVADRLHPDKISLPGSRQTEIAVECLRQALRAFAGRLSGKAGVSCGKDAKGDETGAAHDEFPDFRPQASGPLPPVVCGKP